MAKTKTRRSTGKSVFIGFYDSPQTVSRLTRLADEDGRTVSNLLRKLIADYLKVKK